MPKAVPDGKNRRGRRGTGQNSFAILAGQAGRKARGAAFFFWASSEAFVFLVAAKDRKRMTVADFHKR